MKHESPPSQRRQLRIASLFSGIGGFESGLHKAGHKTVLMCENDVFAQEVLRDRFPDIDLKDDVCLLDSLPDVDLVCAGWPCQDISLAGPMSGLAGERSGLIEEVFRLISRSDNKPEFVLLENVAFAVELKKAEAIRYVTHRLEQLGYSWAYRILDTQLFGLPQRRRRLYVLASLNHDPAAILLDGHSAPPIALDDDARKVGFYWTEGNRGTGWSPNAVPPLKGGSSVGIPSPPAIWNRDNGSFFQPGIEDAERLQGFMPGWTESAANLPRGERMRWRLVGNAVSVPVTEWIGKRLADPLFSIESQPRLAASSKEFARAGQKIKGEQSIFYEPSREGPCNVETAKLDEFAFQSAKPLSRRALSGFTSRLEAAPLRKNPDFLRDLRLAIEEAR